jgi:magnesium-transporting ATPase (P-type)
VFYLFNSRHFIASVISREGLLGNRYALYAVGILLVFQLLFTYAPPMQTLFATTAIGVVDWLYISVVALSIFFLVELEKSYIRWRRRRHCKIPSPLVGEGRGRGK